MTFEQVAEAIPQSRISVTRGRRPRIIIEIPTAALDQPHFRAKPVRVLSVAKLDFMYPRSWHEAVRRVHRGQVFPSAAECSRALGYSGNAVAVRLIEARNRGLTRATLRGGVTVEYCDVESSRAIADTEAAEPVAAN